MSTTTAVAIVVRIKYPGVPESDVLSLQLVTITNDGSVLYNTSHSLQNYASNSSRTVMIKLSGGVYNITITSNNKYGESYPAHLKVNTPGLITPTTTGKIIV